MRKHHGPLLLGAALLLTAVGGSAAAQRGQRPDAVIERVNATVARAQGRAAAAQSRSGAVQDRIGRIPDRAGRATERGLARAGRALESVAAGGRELARNQTRRLLRLVQMYPERLEMTEIWPAVRGQVIAIDPDVRSLDAARSAGYVVVREEAIEGLGIRSVTLQTPRAVSVVRALEELKRIAPGAEFAANHLHAQSGMGQTTHLGSASVAVASQAVGAAALGIIDGGVAPHLSLPGPIEQRSFVQGPPRPNAHATAVASLLVGQGAVQGVRPGAPLIVADIYGNDPTGGNALALAKALGWMAARRVPVVAVSIVGPANPLVAKAIAQARVRGVHVVAPVGNDGPASPPAYPASYAGVVAVTGVDGRRRALVEAGRSLHLDYAAPGADILAANTAGKVIKVRGTSFAVPFVAGRLSSALKSKEPLAVLNAEAEDLGEPGPDRLFGRGLLCGRCGTRLKD